MQRVAIKNMLAAWEHAHPGRTESIFSALRHVELEHLADPRHFDFTALDERRVRTQSAQAGAAHVAAMTMEEEDALIEAAIPRP
jgi:tRNA 2-thiocytidine biosynthesis protein TtcA